MNNEMIVILAHLEYKDATELFERFRRMNDRLFNLYIDESQTIHGSLWYPEKYKRAMKTKIASLSARVKQAKEELEQILQKNLLIDSFHDFTDKVYRG